MLTRRFLLVFSLAAAWSGALGAQSSAALGPTLVVQAAWGDGEDEFGPISTWSGEIQRGPGPFWVDEQERICIFDGARRRLLVFSRDGEWLQTVSLPPSAGIVDDLVVHRGVLYWFTEGGNGDRIYSWPLPSAVPQEAPVTDELVRVLREPDGMRREAFRSHRLMPALDRNDLYYCARTTGVCLPVLRNGVPVSPAAQQSEASFGWEVLDGIRVGWCPSVRGTAKYAHSGGASVERVIGTHLKLKGVSAVGTVLGTAHYLEDGRSVYYIELYSLEGQPLARVVSPSDWPRGYVIGEHLRLSPAGEIYDLHMDSHGVYVTRWS